MWPLDHSPPGTLQRHHPWLQSAERSFQTKGCTLEDWHGSPENTGPPGFMENHLKQTIISQVLCLIFGGCKSFEPVTGLVGCCFWSFCWNFLVCLWLWQSEMQSNCESTVDLWSWFSYHQWKKHVFPSLRDLKLTSCHKNLLPFKNKQVLHVFLNKP